MRVLLLGGTSEARALAALLVDAGLEVTTSLAGRVSRPRLPVGDVRIGGFGGVEPLRAYAGAYDVVVDATHPFSVGISTNATLACTDRPLLRLERSGWERRDGWQVASDHEQAAGLAAGLGHRVFLTVGRQELGRFVPALTGHQVLARVVEEPALTLPSSWQLITSRGPYPLAAERELMIEHDIQVLVTKDSGGDFTSAKLDAAEELGVAVVVVRRPHPIGGVPVVHDVGAAFSWVLDRVAQS